MRGRRRGGRSTWAGGERKEGKERTKPPVAPVALAETVSTNTRQVPQRLRTFIPRRTRFVIFKAELVETPSRTSASFSRFSPGRIAYHFVSTFSQPLFCPLYCPHLLSTVTLPSRIFATLRRVVCLSPDAFLSPPLVPVNISRTLTQMPSFPPFEPSGILVWLVDFDFYK